MKQDSSETMAALVQLNALVDSGEVLPEGISKAYAEEQAKSKLLSDDIALDNDVEQIIDQKMSTILSASKLNESTRRKVQAVVKSEDDLVFIKELGTGSFGRVVKMRHSLSGDIYAVKWINIEKVSQKNVSVNNIVNEAQIIQSINHVNIARLYQYFFDRSNQNYLLLMELCEGQDLTAFISLELIASHRLISWLHQLVNGLVYLHENGILHRDMKPDNIRVLTNDQIKIIDFGLSRELSDSIRAATSVVGTSRYSSIEKSQGLEYDGRDDVWAVGCIFLELVIGKQLSFPPNDSNYEAQLMQLLQQCHKRCPEVAIYIQSCLITNYKARPSSATLLLNIEKESKKLMSNSTSIKVSCNSTMNLDTDCMYRIVFILQL